MQAIRTLIVDDEKLSRQRIRRLLAGEPDIDIAGECSTGQEAMQALSENAPDLMFLDVQMPGTDGFAVAESPAARAVPVIVFITAYDEYALRAFDVHAFDYLLKPFDRIRFLETLRRARVHLNQVRNGEVNQRLVALVDELQSKRMDREKLAVRTPGHIHIVRMDQIDWIEAADNYVCLHVGPDTHVLRETMNTIETRLNKDRFMRVHRSTIVNVDRIKELQPWFRGDYRIILEDGKQLTLSRNYRERLEAALLRTTN